MGGRGTTLEQMLYDLRSEVGQSTNPAVSRSTRGRFITLLNRVQKRLWYDHDWAFLEVKRNIRLEAGSRYYDFPTDVDMDRTITMEVFWGGEWIPLKFGIGGFDYSQSNSDGPNAERIDPVLRWNYYLESGTDAPQFEVWPMPATDGTAIPVGETEPPTLDNWIRVTGTRKLYPLVNDADTCLLDSDMIVLYAAAEVLMKRKAADAQAKLENANAIYTRLKGKSTPSTPFKIGAEINGCENTRRPIELRVAYAGQQDP